MALVQVKPAAFLVREESFDLETTAIVFSGLITKGHIHHIAVNAVMFDPV
jgi:hypothetical protein